MIKILQITVFTFFVKDMATTNNNLIRLWNCSNQIMVVDMSFTRKVKTVNCKILHTYSL
jgi:hypothetical protein